MVVGALVAEYRNDRLMWIFPSRDADAGRFLTYLKERIKEAILDGQIHNDRQEAMELLLKIASEKGLEQVK